MCRAFGVHFFWPTLYIQMSIEPEKKFEGYDGGPLFVGGLGLGPPAPHPLNPALLKSAVSPLAGPGG